MVASHICDYLKRKKLPVTTLAIVAILDTPETVAETKRSDVTVVPERVGLVEVLKSQGVDVVEEKIDVYSLGSPKHRIQDLLFLRGEITLEQVELYPDDQEHTRVDEVREALLERSKRPVPGEADGASEFSLAGVVARWSGTDAQRFAAEFDGMVPTFKMRRWKTYWKTRESLQKDGMEKARTAKRKARAAARESGDGADPAELLDVRVYKSFLEEMVERHVAGTLSGRLCGWLKDDGGSFGASATATTAVDAARDSKLGASGPAAAALGSTHIIFVLGGLSISEVQSLNKMVQKAREEANKRILVVTTQMLTARQFIHMLDLPAELKLVGSHLAKEFEKLSP